MRGPRSALLSLLVESVDGVAVAHPVRVAIDGPPASGKTTLADELATALRARGSPVVRATIDDFLYPRAQRYRRGEYSAEGCYFDTHDCNGMVKALLDPLGPGGDRRFRAATYDCATDAVVSPPPTTASHDAVLIVDGVFLLRPELIARWDLRILVSTARETTVARALLRERRVSTPSNIERRWRQRYLPAQDLYVGLVAPADLADVIVHNDEPRQPAWEIRTDQASTT